MSAAGLQSPIVFSGRRDQMQKGAQETAQMVRRARQERPVRLIVNGAPPETARAARRLLSQVAGRAVEVRGYTSGKDAQREEIRTADVVLVPCLDEHVGLTALDAIVAGVPILVPDTSGIGRFLLDSGRFDPRLTEPSVIRCGDDGAVPLEQWTAALADVLGEPDAARQRAASLRDAIMTTLQTLQSAGGSAADLVQAISAARDRGRNGD